MAEWLDLVMLVRGMYAARQSKHKRPAVVGGCFAAEKLQAFLVACGVPRQGMPWALWQWTDRIDLQHGAGIPGDVDYLDRGRLFGAEGDLELRRDGNRFRWRYVGEHNDALLLSVQAGEFGTSEPATGADTVQLSPYERTALLWGEDKSGQGKWHEDRVGWANLDYPGMKGNPVVQVRYIEYLLEGNVELVRLLGLEKGPDRPVGGDNA